MCKQYYKIMDELETFEWAERPYVPKEKIEQEEAPVCEIGCDSCSG